MTSVPSPYNKLNDCFGLPVVFFRYLRNGKVVSACVLGLSRAKILQISDNFGRPIIASGLSF